MPRLDRSADEAAPAEPDTAPPLEQPAPSGVTNTEPVALAGAVQGVLIALLAVLQGFKVTHLDQEQVSLLLALYVAVVAAATAAARSKAWSPASVAKLQEQNR